MTDETRVNSNPSTPATPPAASTPAASATPSNSDAKPKSNTVLIVALVVFGLLILAAAVFFTGGYSLEQGGKPTPTITQTNQEVPTTEPTAMEEEETPTAEVTQSTSPTTGQQVSPTTGQTPVTTTQTP